MNVHATSCGLDLTSLTAGRDVVLDVHPPHGVALPSGVLAHDHLALPERFGVDALALQLLARWRDHQGDALRLGGFDLAEIWAFELYETINECLVRALGLRSAIAAHRPGSLTVMDSDPLTELATLAAGEATGVPVVVPPHRPAPVVWPWAPSVPVRPRLRRAAVRGALRWGLRSHLKPGSTLFLSYWPLMPLLDRMLADARWRPAIAVERRPTNPARSVSAAGQGGWLGVASHAAVARAGERVARALRAVSPPPLDVGGLPVGTVIHHAAVSVARRRAGHDLAALAVARDGVAGGRLRRVIGNNDLDPYARLVLLAARDAGIGTFCLAHGAYLLPQPMSDLEVADEVALWSPAIAPPIANRDRPLHVVGYPLPRRSVATRRFRSRRTPRVVLLAQSGTPSTASVDGRIVMQHYAAGLAGVAASLPGATVVLRPHPSQGPLPVASLAARFPSIALEVDRTSELGACLAGGDVCIGGTSAATLEAAVFGTPVVVLNITGFDWRWPLGGETSVPVAHSPVELAECLRRWHRDGTLPGGDELLEALGADGGDASERLIAALEGRGPAPVPVDRMDWPPHMRGAAPTVATRTDRSPSGVPA